MCLIHKAWDAVIKLWLPSTEDLHSVSMLLLRERLSILSIQECCSFFLQSNSYIPVSSLKLKVPFGFPYSLFCLWRHTACTAAFGQKWYCFVCLTLDLLSKRMIDSAAYAGMGCLGHMKSRVIPVKMVWWGGCTHTYIGNDRDLCEESIQEWIT